MKGVCFLVSAFWSPPAFCLMSPHTWYLPPETLLSARHSGAAATRAVWRREAQFFCDL
jgi:hypothetical protein